MPVGIIRIDRSDNHWYSNGFPKWHEPYAEPIHITTLCRPTLVCLHQVDFSCVHQAKQTPSQPSCGCHFPPLMPNSSSASNNSSPFLNRVRAACRRKGYTYRTEKTDLRWIVRYVKYRDRPEHPRVSDAPCTSNLRASFRRSAVTDGVLGRRRFPLLPTLPQKLSRP